MRPSHLFAAAGLALAAAGAAGQAPTAAAQDPAYRQIAQRVAPHVHVLRLPAPHFLDPVGNVTVIEQSDGLVLVDSGDSFGSGQRVVALVRAISAKPVKAVLLTHFHSDHPLGLAAIAAAWPEAEIIAHRETIAAMRAGMPPGVPETPSPAFEAERARNLTASFARIRAQVDAEVQDEAERAGWARELATLPGRVANIAGTRKLIPRRAFTDRLVIPDRVTPVEILFLGRANTAGDALAWMPSERVLAAGDIVVDPIPYMFNVYPGEMRRVFARIRALGFRTLIPGHGAPQGAAALERLDALIGDVERQIRPLAREGVPLDQIEGRTDFSAQRTAFAGSDPWLAYWFGAYALRPLIESVYREARGEPLGEPRLRHRPSAAPDERDERGEVAPRSSRNYSAAFLYLKVARHLNEGRSFRWAGSVS